MRCCCVFGLAAAWFCLRDVSGEDFQADLSDLSAVRLLHITDSHISLSDEVPPRSSRMFGAYARSRNRDTKSPTTPQQEFSRLVGLAQDLHVDLVVLGGDIFNFPSNQTVTWVLEQLRTAGKSFVFTSGNHDWMLEGQQGASRYDAARISELESTFRPLYEQSLSNGGSCYMSLGHWNRPGIGILYGCTVIKGLLLLFIDNSNYQVDADQLEFARVQLESVSKDTPIVILLHIPLMLPGVTLPAKELCGHAQWGAATDTLWQLEGRPRWPAGNLQSTLDFRDLLQAKAAPNGPVVAVLSGHTHEDASVLLRPPAETAETCEPWGRSWTVRSEGGREKLKEGGGALQYTTSSATEGAYRVLTIY
ncbi:YGR125W [Symbiodinium natans]|uniref:YGR125W protein n=1 Tax=Symbiodinium natans TaxID=878477 RepID=A0A812JGF2_9DINO|nr:YGR125W [Symbiodinium natans]